jgi:hypothetical protein
MFAGKALKRSVFSVRVAVWRVAIFVLGLIQVSTAFASGTIGYGSRQGMEVSVISMEGVDTSHAIIHTRHTRENAIAFCDAFADVRPDKDACIREELATPLNDVISANCTTGEFTDFYGNHYRFLGLNRREGDPARPKYAVLNLSNREIADGTTSSGYPTNILIFGALCPSQAPLPFDQ